MTPKQMTAFLFIANKRRNIERAQYVNDHIVAGRADKDGIDKHVKELTS